MLNSRKTHPNSKPNYCTNKIGSKTMAASSVSKGHRSLTLKLVNVPFILGEAGFYQFFIKYI